jgi:hypothetical protein
MHRAVNAADREPDVTTSRFRRGGQRASVGQVAGAWSPRKLKSKKSHAIIEGIDGRTHHLVFSDLEMTGDAKPGAIVETRAYDDAGFRKRLPLATRSDLTVKARVSAPGATWIDRRLLAKQSALSGADFGAEVRAATDRRIDYLVEQTWRVGKANRSSLLVTFSLRSVGASSTRPPPNCRLTWESPISPRLKASTSRGLSPAGYARLWPVRNDR